MWRNLYQRNAALYGLLFAFICIAVQYSSNALAWLTKHPGVYFQKVAEGKWSADVSRVPGGLYYVSVGRPRGVCQIWVDRSKVTQNGFEYAEGRDLLLLGATIELRNSRTLSIECVKQQGFAAALTTAPVLTDRRVGLVLQLWRGFTQTLLGPTVAGYLLVYLLICMLSNLGGSSLVFEKNDGVRRRELRLAIFAGISFLYSLSLAHFGWLLWPPKLATEMHIFLRSVFAYAFLEFCSLYWSPPAMLRMFHLFQIFGVLVVNSAFSEFSVGYYRFSFLLFVISSGACALGLAREAESSATIRLLFNIAFSWTALQPIDYLASFVLQWENLTPSLLAVLSVGLARLQHYERWTSQQVELISRQLINAQEDARTVSEVLRIAAATLGRALGFPRFSAYADSFLFGESLSPSSTFVRVTEFGQRTSSTSLEFVDLLHGDGEFMRTAVLGNTPVSRWGARDDAWFVVVPVSKYACINFSHVKPESPKLIGFQMDVLQRVSPILKSVEGRILGQSSRQVLGLEQLRYRRLSWPVVADVGCVFADIDDYSMLCERYGQLFSEFVSVDYLPALLKAVDGLALHEYLRGDEVYLVVTQEFLSQAETIHDATLTVIRRIKEFERDAGSSLCAAKGYPPLSWKVGANVGQVTISCDPVKVRTTGSVVNEAKRLLDSAGKGSVLVHGGAFEQASVGLALGPVFTVLQKKNIIPARQLRLVVREGTQSYMNKSKNVFLD